MKLPRPKGIITLIFLILGLAGAQHVAFNIDSHMAVAGIREHFEEQPAVPNLEFETLETLPELTGASEWVNQDFSNIRRLRDTPVLVHFWSYSCIQCQEDLAWIKKWNSTFRSYGLQIISVHSPSYVSETRLERVKAGIADLGISYPVALDQNFEIWGKFYNRFWPTTYLFDQEHNLVYRHIGTGSYEETEDEILALLDLTEEDIVEKEEEEGPPPYFHTGHYKQKRFTSFEKMQRYEPAVYTMPDRIFPDTYALEGEWEFTELTAVLVGDEGRVKFGVDQPTVNVSFSAADRRQTRVTVRMDGEYVREEFAGPDLRVDVSGGGVSYFYIEAQKHYELLENLRGYHEIEFLFDKPGLTVHSITFPDRAEE